MNELKGVDYNLLFEKNKERKEYKEKTINLLSFNLADSILLLLALGDIQYLHKYTVEEFPIVMINCTEESIKDIPTGK
ncbi:MULTISPECIES: hypothetical protein [Oceanobacillus]|uniref:Uncharacterized protein n=2 Tax=Oceanobacillus TaxID=182709 RepID=A0ABQ2NQT1_9BACI|nr:MULTISPECIES: hypothetical protein [Oceanobacillus]MCT1902079.1 hypothetical protein [Oceanobacillus sojae]GGP07507.1 hypothetical protein GCM10011346_03770 [Oceanobacillus neutriphilus]